MNRLNVSILGLALLFLGFSGVALEQASSAQTTNLGCQAISCKATASCGTAGTTSGCNITCADGATINCDPKKDEGSEIEIGVGAS